MGSAALLYLFQQGELRLKLEEVRSGITDEIEAAPEDHLLQADDALWARALAERYTVEAPVLRNADLWMEEPQPTRVDVSQESNRLIRDRSQAFYIPGHKTVVHIPFSGDGNVFHFQPSRFALRQFVARIGENELLLDVEYPDDAPVSIKGRAESFIESIAPNLDGAERDIAQFNSSLEGSALTAIRDRRRRIERHRANVAATGLPIGPPRDPSKTYIEDVIVRRPAPLLPADEGQPLELEPVLSDEVYEHILLVIRMASLAMERSPGTYARMGEEDRRQVLLAALNTHYKGQATAEAFNVSGKTDILVRHEGSNLFIAELKFSTGPKGFTEALEQLFGYQAWRDTKLALVMFVRERDLTAIIEKARGALETHPQFVEWQEAATETELRVTVSWEGDERRRATLNLFFVSTPVA